MPHAEMRRISKDEVGRFAGHQFRDIFRNFFSDRADEAIDGSE
jgi:hypothetical protein